MVSLQPKLNLKVSQKQILTPGLVQMVSVLALNKLELKDMINAELVENPVLDELEDSVPLLDDAARKEEERVVTGEENTPETKADSFEEIDFGSFFRDYLDPGYRSPDLEAIEKPSFENFLSRPTTLTDHLMWQLGSMSVSTEVAEAAELVIGNLSEEGYLIATDEELMAAAYDQSRPVVDDPEQRSAEVRSKIAQFPAPRPAVAPVSTVSPVNGDFAIETADNPWGIVVADDADGHSEHAQDAAPLDIAAAEPEQSTSAHELAVDESAAPVQASSVPTPAPTHKGRPLFTIDDLHEAIQLVREMDPIGVAARDVRECLIVQLQYQLDSYIRNRNGNGTMQALQDAIQIVDKHLHELQNKQYREIAKAIGRPIEAVQHALDFIKTLDPRPGLRYNKVSARLIEPDVAFVKQGEEYLVLMNDEDVPQLRLNPTYRRMLGQLEGEKTAKDSNEREVKTYIKDKYKSAIQLIKNIEQRKQTILKVCYAIIGRQGDFLDRGIDQLKPMMIKEVAEEIGVHPSTVSRAVANKFVHTPQGVFELRYFFSESVQGPEGGGTSLLILKRRVKKLIDEEDSSKPLTDEQITRILQSQGIQVTRRTVAKYREDMKIPSTHQRRVKS
jgi:RNA polymerase sigma-54 factor